MATHLTGHFESRRMAEMAVERLVQEYQIKRDPVVVAPEGAENTAGVADAPSAQLDEPDAALNGRIAVTVTVPDEAAAAGIREAFAEFAAREVERD